MSTDWTHVLCRLCMQIKHQVPTQNKEVDDVLGGDEAWANVDSTEGATRSASGKWQPPELTPTRRLVAARCPKCDHTRAFFMLVQTRSADEPMTTFYRVRWWWSSKTPRAERTVHAQASTPSSLSARVQCAKCKHPWKEG